MTTLYESRVMLNAMSNQVRPDSFLRALLNVLPDNYHDTATIEIDEEEIAQGVAAYNSRTGEAVEVAKEGYDTKVHVAPYTDEMVTMTPKELDTRIPGNTVYEGSAASRRARNTDKNIRKLSERLDRLEEKQLAEIIQAGKVTVSNSSTGVNYEVDFGLPTANKTTLSGTAVWGGAASDIKGNLQTWARVLTNKGYAPKDLILDPDAADLLIADTEIQGLLDNRRIIMGEINPQLVADQRASYIGRLNLPGLNINIWSYYGGYETDASTFVNYLTQYRAVMVGSGFQVEPNYGKIENLKTNFIGRRYPNMWDDGGRGKKFYIGMESSPCMVGRYVKSLFSAIVVS